MSGGQKTDQSNYEKLINIFRITSNLNHCSLKISFLKKKKLFQVNVIFLYLLRTPKYIFYIFVAFNKSRAFFSGVIKFQISLQLDWLMFLKAFSSLKFLASFLHLVGFFYAFNVDVVKDLALFGTVSCIFHT